MKAADLRGKTPEELRTQLEALKKEAFNLRFQQATNQLENPARMRLVRRDVAGFIGAEFGRDLEAQQPAATDHETLDVR